MATISEALALAFRHHQSGRLAEAENLYHRILEVDPDNADALHLLGIILRRRGDPAQAATLIEKALARCPDLNGGRFNLGNALADLGRYGEAAQSFRIALMLQPADPTLHYVLGQAFVGDGRHAQAMTVFRRLLRLTPENGDAWFNLASTLQASGDPMAAAELFPEALRRSPDHAPAWANLGVVRHLLGRLDEAVACYRRSIALDPAYAGAFCRFAQTRLSRGEPAAAEAALRRAGESLEAEETHERARSYRNLAAMAGDPSVPAGLVVRGTFRDTSGYAYMVRQFTRQFHARGLPVQLLDVRLSFLPRMSERHRDPLLESLTGPVRARAMLNFMIPSVLEPVPGLATVLFSMFEARTIPPDWLAFCRGLHHLIVPTPSSAEAWIRAGFPADRVSLCPLGVDPAPQAGTVAAMPVHDASGRRLADYSVRIANVSDFTERKNLDGLIRAWVRATSRDDDAALVLKIGKGHPGEEGRISAFLARAAASAGRTLDQAAPVFVVSGQFSDDEMTSLLAGATHYWSMSHGEGWDLPMTQAGAMGLGLIAPCHSAYLGYLDESVAAMIPCRTVPGYPPYVGIEWWEPDEAVAAEIVAGIVRGRSGPAPSARERLARDFNWSRSTDRLLGVLREIGAV